MLRRIDVADPWRTLEPGFWPDSSPLGKRTVVYGHNGSGKSTISELLLSIANRSSATDVDWYFDTGIEKVSANQPQSADIEIAVFTRKWVDDNLSAFLSGAEASAIVTLGREAIDAAAKELGLTQELTEAKELQKSAREKQKRAKTAFDEHIRSVQDRVVEELGEIDHKQFSRHRYSVTKIQQLLREDEGEHTSREEYLKAIRRLGEPRPKSIPEIGSATHLSTDAQLAIETLLSRLPVRSEIDRLAGDPRLQEWVERGVDLHREADSCGFCTGGIDPSRRVELANHFDPSWLRARDDARAAVDQVRAERGSLIEWSQGLPSPASIEDEFRAAYEAAKLRAQAVVEVHLAALARIENTLEEKVRSPESAPNNPDWAALQDPIPWEDVQECVDKHNKVVDQSSDLTQSRLETALSFIVGEQSATMRTLEQDVKASEAQLSEWTSSVKTIERELQELRASQFTTAEMAETLTADLSRVYGKNHLSVVPRSDGRSYYCRRGDHPATNLSDGERTTLSLLYFLRSLEDRQSGEVERSSRIVIIDDPSSSLDRESVFATHQWLVDTLTGVGQYVVLTHDFSLLRLFTKSLQSSWNTSQKEIRDGNSEERRFPRVAFLEVFASISAGRRTTRVGDLPKSLLKNTSEYAYLFSSVMAAASSDVDYDRLFLLPNAARRVLEIFATYKVPHRTNFHQQLQVLGESIDGEPFRDVYDFCNRFSHGEGGETVDVLDARAVHLQLRRSMEFMRAADPEHFRRMCEATNADSSFLE